MHAKFSLVFTSICLVALISCVVKLVNLIWLRPKKLERCLRAQGLNGNPYRLLLGDMRDLMRVMKEAQPKSIEFTHNITPHCLRYFHQIVDKYGPDSFIWFGPFPRLNITDPELMKEILSKPKVFQKPGPDLSDMIVGGLFRLEGDKWAKHRKIVNPAFHLTNLKNTLPAISLSCSNMVKKWDSMVCSSQGSCEIDVWPYLGNLSGDVISRTAFGSSHEEGMRIFQLQREQVSLALQMIHVVAIPGWRYFPTKANKRLKAVSKEIRLLLSGIVKKRENLIRRGENPGDDLLGILMESNLRESQEHGNKAGARMTIEEVIEECKLFYFAGSESTSNLLVWTMILLSKHSEWQMRAREEVFQVFGNKEPTLEGLNHLKTITMILYEVLRLYPAAPLMVRNAIKSVKLGDMTLPAGAQLSLLIGLLHHDPKVWGDDVHEFNPQRFSQGISAATKSQCSFVPFSFGPRICIGQNFAMIEAKIALVMILRCFSFELSPSYLHSPFLIITLQPQHGAKLILHKL